MNLTVISCLVFAAELATGGFCLWIIAPSWPNCRTPIRIVRAAYAEQQIPVQTVCIQTFPFLSTGIYSRNIRPNCAILN